MKEFQEDFFDSLNRLRDYDSPMDLERSWQQLEEHRMKSKTGSTHRILDRALLAICVFFVAGLIIFDFQETVDSGQSKTSTQTKITRDMLGTEMTSSTKAEGLAYKPILSTDEDVEVVDATILNTDLEQQSTISNINLMPLSKEKLFNGIAPYDLAIDAILMSRPGGADEMIDHSTSLISNEVTSGFSSDRLNKVNYEVTDQKSLNANGSAGLENETSLQILQGRLEFNVAPDPNPSFQLSDVQFNQSVNALASSTKEISEDRIKIWAGWGMAFSPLRFSAKTREHQIFTQKRREDESTLETYLLELGINYLTSKRAFLSGGFTHTVSFDRQKLHYSTSKSYKLEDVHLRTIHNRATGEYHRVKGDTIVQGEQITSGTRYSRYTRSEISLQYGYKLLDRGQFGLAVTGGVTFNLSNRAKGKVLTSATPVTYHDLDSTQDVVYKKSFGLGLTCGIQMNYHINHKIDIGFRPTFVYYLSSLSKTEYPLDARLMRIGTSIGLLYRL